MSDLKISQLPALSGSDLASADQLAVVDSSASQTSKLTVGDLIANGVTLINDNTIPGAKILFDSGSIATAALADSGITTVKIASDAIDSTKIADNVIVALASTLPTSGGFIGQLALDTDDNSLYVWSGTTWLNTKAPASVNAFTDTTAGIINITTAVSSGTATVTASIDNTASAAQFLAGPVGSGGTVGYRTIDGGDLPTATTTSKGGVIVNGGGLTLSTDTIQIDNSVTASSTKHLVTYDANGLISGGSVISSSDLPVATNSAKGAVIASDGLAVDSNGNLSIDNTVTAGTYTKVTVSSKGVVSSGDTLAASDIPDHSAAKLTSGTIGSSLIANDAVTADKLANESTVKFGGALGSDNVTIFPAGDFKGQLFWDETSLDLYVYTGSAFIPITVLSGNLVNAGTYNASTNLVSSVTTAGSSAGFSAGSALPAPVGANLNHYVVVETSGTGSGAAPAVALAPPDMLLSNGVGTEYRLIDVSNAIAGQTAANISFIASGTIAATDVQAALQEVDSEKLAIAGGTMTGDLNLGTSTNVVFEGSSADDYETTLTVTNPTADRTITFPNVTGTVVTTGDTGSVTSTMIADGAIVNADINASAEIAVSKLANGTARQLLQTDSGGSGVEFTSNVDVPGTLDVTSGATFDSTVAVTGLLSANGKLAYPAGSASAVSLYSGSDTDTGIYSPGSNQFGIATAGTSRVVVDASGNVGIGTTSIDASLHVKGAGTHGTFVLEAGGTSGTSNQIYIQGHNNAGTSLGELHFEETATNQGAIVFKTNGGSVGERMRITSAGRVGIGTTSPGQLLHVDAGSGGSHAEVTVRTTGYSNNQVNLIAQLSPEVMGYVESSERALGFKANGAEAMRIDSSGNVGIGTTGPSGKLHIQATDSANSPSLLYLENLGTDNNTGSTIFFRNRTGTAFTDCSIQGVGTNTNQSALVFSTESGSGATERMRIDSSGNVHLGTSTSRAGLTVALGSSSIPAAGANTASAVFSNATDSAVYGVNIGANTSGVGYIQSQRTDGNAATYDLAIQPNGGKVGIGTAAPQYELQVHDSSGSSTIHLTNGTVGSSSSDGARITGSTSGIFYLENLENAATVFTTNDTERMRIDSSGRVAIGTDAPPTTADLTVRAPNPELSLYASANFSSYIMMGDTDDYDNGFIEYDNGDSNKFMRFVTNASTRMLITKDGEVLVGKQTASNGTEGVTIGSNYLAVTRNSNPPVTLNRLGTDGHLVRFEAQNTLEGDIHVNGSTVTFNGAHLTRWSQLAGGAERIEILRGSVLSNLDEMCEWAYEAQDAVLYSEEDELPEGVSVGDVKIPARASGKEDNEQLNRMKVSDVEGDKNISGVFQSWDDDDGTHTNDFYCAMTGDFVIRIAQGTTVERGDLLMSAGDGTAKPQDDDIVRSKTIAKVTSTTVSETYSDGSYCVPCVLMAC